MSSKPNNTFDPKWATIGNPDDVQKPGTALQDNGVPSGGAWAREHLNWQFYAIWQWIAWVKGHAVNASLNLSDLGNTNTALNNLGGRAAGKAVFASTTQLSGREALGVGAVGNTVFTAPNQKTAMRALLPIGTVYTQYPTESAPSTLFGGTWERLYHTEGVFFRTEGGNASAWGSGIQDDLIKNHIHEMDFSFRASGSGDNRSANQPNDEGSSDNIQVTNNNIGGGAETRPKNRTIRIWKKISDTDG